MNLALSSSTDRAETRLGVVVMGVSGSGKSTVGAALAVALGLEFVDGDSLHDAASVEKMRAGIALVDADRWPWLDRIGARLAGGGTVIACSALRRAYRDRLRAAAPDLCFVFLEGGAEVLAARLSGRGGHYMPASLLASQLQTLEMPGADEADVEGFDVGRPVDEIVARAAAWLRARSDR